MEILSSGAYSSIKANYINVDTLYAEHTNITVELPPFITIDCQSHYNSKSNFIYFRL